jgi:hypothetical protein
MRRAGVVVFPLLLATALVVASLVAMRTNRPPDWQLELDKYVEYKDSLSSGTTTVQLVDRASRPWNFSRDMSHAIFGDSPYYQTDDSYGGRRGPRPLPFPPEDVRCVLLERDHNEETTYNIVFVAEHQDLYNADVVIHEGASDLSDQPFAESISEIGCELVLAQLGQSSVHR